MTWISAVQTRDLQSKKACNRHSSFHIVTLDTGFQLFLSLLQFFQLTNRLIIFHYCVFYEYNARTCDAIIKISINT